MSLSNDEFAMLERGRLSPEVRRTQARELLDLAYRQLEELSGQQRKALKVMDVLLHQKQRSLCWRVPAFFALQWSRVRYFLGRGKK